MANFEMSANHGQSFDSPTKVSVKVHHQITSIPA
ncbi:hypothetical protein X740_21795 [Mesorhizobium sp. LNHC221B00]|nr:hypothetical protein X740_21795 [Mesorhizobium sp. LNHC221B00]